jgi:hypothetical protein
MLSVALPFILAVTSLTPVPGVPAATGATAADPSVRISLNHRSYERGDRARVTVNIRDDGYLVVLHLDADGLVRVLFPIDPGDDNFVRGGQSYEIRGRGDRDAFTINASSGTGTVYAAWSAEPFRFDDFVRGDHWDYRVIGDSALPNDPETGLTNIAQRMSTAHFEYDLTTYDVARQVAYSYAPAYYPPPVYAPIYYGGCWADPWCGGFYRPYRSGFSFSVSFGSPYYYDPFFYDPFFYGYGYGYYHRPFYRSCCFYRPVVVYSPFRPYQWKGGNIGGGGTIGVQYRPRTALAMRERGPVSPMSLGSRYRNVTVERTAVSRGRVGTTEVIGVRRGAAERGVSGAERVGVARAGRSAALREGDWRNSGRRAVTVDGVDRPAPRRAEPLTSGGRGAMPLDAPRRVEPRATDGPRRLTSPGDAARRGIVASPDARVRSSEATGMRAAPSRGYERPTRSYESPSPSRATPRYEAPRSAPARAEPRYEPRRAEQPRIEMRRSAPPPVMRSAPRAAPAPHVQRSGGGGGRRRP